MARRIEAILSLKDKMSPALKKTSENTKDFKKETERARKSVGNMAIHASDKIGGMITKITKAAGAMASLTAGAAIKTGLSEAMDLEGYKAQIETATKDTKKAGEIMEWCMQLANKTPFEGGEVVEAASKFEAMGMSAKEWVTYAGDMAGATNKSLDQATEALIDAQAGELERLKEFGIKKADIAAKANEMFANEEVVNAKGQIVNQEKFNEALLQLMNEKFTGGMEKKAKTLRGVMSTITGITKNGLATIMGMKSDGTVSKGSPLDLMKEKAQKLADKMIELQANGTFEKISKNVASGIKKIMQKGAELAAFVKEHKDIIVKIAKVGGTLTGVVFTVGKVVKAVNQTKKAIHSAQKTISIMKKAFNLNPHVLMIMAVVAAIALIGYAVYKNWDKIKAVVKKAKESIASIKEKYEELKQKVVDGAKKIEKTVKEKVDSVKQAASDLKKHTVDRFREMADNAKKAVTAPFEWIEAKIDTIKSAASWVKDKITGSTTMTASVPQRPIGRNANGTQYWRGGATSINEHGPEVIELPSGSKIYPHQQSKNMGKSMNIQVSVNIQGNVIGNEEYTNTLGNEVAKKILLALGNT